MPGKDGLLHISEIDWKRFDTMEETGLKEGDTIAVKLVDIDPKTGKFKLSHRVLLDKPEGYEERPPRSERPQRNDRGDRGDRGPRGDRGDRGGRPDRGPRHVRWCERSEKGSRKKTFIFLLLDKDLILFMLIRCLLLFFCSLDDVDCIECKRETNIRQALDNSGIKCLL